MTTYNDPEIGYAFGDITYNGIGSVFDDVFITVQAGFGYAPLDASVSWTYLTAKVRSVDIKRGKQSQYSEYGAATCQVTLSNNDRRFDPLHSGGPYYGNLKPMVPIRVQSTRDGTTETLFYGFAQTWRTDYTTANTDNVATVQCVDLNRILGNTNLPRSSLHGEIESLNPVSYVDMQAMYDNPDTGRKTFDDYETDNALVRVTGLQPIPNSYQAAKPVGAEGHVEMVSGDTWLVNPMTTSEGFVYGGECWFELRETTLTDTAEVMWGVSQDIGGVKHEATWDLGTYDYNTTPHRTYQMIFPVVKSELLGVDGSTGGTQTQIAFGVHCWAWRIVASPTLPGRWEIYNYLDGVQIGFTTMMQATPTIVSGNQLLIDPANTMSDSWEMLGVSHFAVFPTAPTVEQIEKHWDAGQGYTDTVHDRVDRVLDWAQIPAAWRDIDTNTSGGLTSYRPGSATITSYLQQLAHGDSGDWFVNKDGHVRFVSGTSLAGLTSSHTFGNGQLPFRNVSVSAASVESVVNHVTVQTFRGTSEAEDATSVAAYGRQSESISVPTIASISKGKDIATARVAARKDPQTQVSQMSVDMRTDVANLWPVMSGMDLDEAVTVTFTPNGIGSPISQDVRVQGLSHNITPAGWRSQVYLGGLS